MPFFDQLHPYRPVLYLLAVIGFMGFNGVFLYYAVLHPETMDAAWQNPISAVFMMEAFLLVAVLAWLAHVAGLRRPGALTFVVLSLVGSLAFSVPAFLLWHLRRRDHQAGANSGT